MSQDLTHALLQWYDRHRRDLPWRRSRDPYRIWLSEVMLQQTRVETVLPYYEKFLQRFPTIEDLAAAAEEEVLASWSGLGYYRRARQLHRAAREVVERGGTIPETFEGLLSLPGVGPYTAAAVASIAFGVKEPVIDGNVERVISRLLAYGGDPKSRRGHDILRAHAAGLLAEARPGDSNQALMELGATLCTPRRPRCSQCPLGEGCRAAAQGQLERYPTPRPRRDVERVRAAMVVIRGGTGREEVLLFRRPETSDLLAGTWELPWVELPGKGCRKPAVIARALARRYGGRWSLLGRRGQVRHRITFRSLEIEVWDGRLDAAEYGVAEGPEAGWFDVAERRHLPLSSLIGKVLRCAQPPSGS